MELEDALFAWASTQSTLTAYIGAPPAAVRFFKLKIPQGAKGPSIVQQRSNTARQELACMVDGTVRVSVQIDHYANTPALVGSLARAFREALRRGNVSYPINMGTGDSPSVSVKVKAATLENEFDSDDPDPGLSRRTQFWSFWIWEP